MNEEQTTPTMGMTVIEQVRNDALDLVSRANGLANITTDAEYREAAEFRIFINEREKKSILKCKPMRDATTLAWRQGIALVDSAIEPFRQVKEILDPPLAAWVREQERLRRLEEERRLAEAKRQQDEDILARALEAQSSGDTDRAEAIINQPIAPVPPVLVPKAAPVAGMSFPRYYGVDEIVDIRRLAAAALAGDVPMDALEPNMTHLKKVSTATKGTAKYPGVTFTCRDGVRS